MSFNTSGHSRGILEAPRFNADHLSQKLPQKKLDFLTQTGKSIGINQKADGTRLNRKFCLATEEEDRDRARPRLFANAIREVVVTSGF